MAVVEDSSQKKPQNVKRRIGKVILQLENCILPLDKLENTPSMQDGLDREVENQLRFLGCDLVQTAGILLRLPQVAMATGQVLYQRFYFSKSFVRHQYEIVAMACVLLACKIEEAPRRPRDIANVFHHIKQVRQQKTISSLPVDSNYIKLKNDIIKAERRILKELGFCVHVKHPHKIIVTLLQVLGCERNGKLMQSAWNYMNDSLRSDIFVRQTPETIACACIYLSARLLQVALPKTPAWYAVFDVSEENIQDCCQRILALYTAPKPDAEKLEKRIEELKQIHDEAKQKARASASGGDASKNGTPTPATSFSPCSGSRANSPRNATSKETHVSSNSSKDVSKSSSGKDRHRSRSRSRGKSHKSRGGSKDGSKRRSSGTSKRHRDDSRHRHRQHRGRSLSSDRSGYSLSPVPRKRHRRHRRKSSLSPSPAHYYSSSNKSRDSSDKKKVSSSSLSATNNHHSSSTSSTNKDLRRR